MAIIDKCLHGARAIGECRECKNFYALRARSNNRSNYLWVSAKHRARKRGIEFNISVEDIVVPTHCPVLGIILDSRNRDHVPSLDEIIQGTGYVKGNFAVISGKANRIKSDATLEDIQAIECYIRLRGHPMYGVWEKKRF